MANIKSYDAPQGLGLQPTETGIEANVQSARRIGAFADQAGNALAQTGERAAGAIKDAGQVAVQYVDNKDRSNVWTAATGLLANLDAKWNTATKGNGLDPSDPNYVAPADPRDPTIAQKFMDEQVQPALDKLRQIPMGEAGNQYAESQIEQIRQHLSQKVTADLSTMAGEAAVVNDRQTTNNLSNYVTTSPDFHSVDMALQMHKDASATASSNPNISGPQLGQLKEHFQQSQEQIVHAAASAAISKAADPQAVAASFIERYPDYIKGDEANTFAKAALTQTKVNTYYDKQTALARRQLGNQNVHEAATKTITDNITFDPQTGHPIVDPKFFPQVLDIARKNPDAPNAGETVRTMLSWGESQQNKGAKPADDPATKTDLTDRMFSPDKPTTTLDLMKARAEGKISDQTFQAYHGLVQELAQAPLKGPVWQDTIGAVKGELILSGVGLPGKDIVGEGNYAKWAQTFFPQYLAQSRAGTLPPNALDVKDPKSMISQSMAPFKRTIAQRTQDYLATLGGVKVNTDGSVSGNVNGPVRAVNGVPVPAALGGIAALQYNPTNKQWRDQTSGIVYDSAGQPVGK